MEDAGFSTPQASKLTRVTELTLQNWNRRGFLKPSVRAALGPGRKRGRLYSFRDLIAIRVADDLRARGIEVHKLRRVVEYLRKRKGLDRTTSDLLAGTMLVTDGIDVYEVEGDACVSALCHPDQCTTMVVPLGRFVELIKADVEKAFALQRAA